MGAYAVLVQPSANRVYAGAAPALTAAELRALDRLALGGVVTGVAVTERAGVPYVTFEAPDDALPVVANLSTRYAVFADEGDGLLRPVDVAPLDRWDEDLVSIQRYPGRTNEQLTRLLLNLALAAGPGAPAFTGAVRPRVLDPLCGRGTTMNVAARCGLDAAGVDVDRKDVDAYLQFFTTWLKNKRAKHSSKRVGPVTTITFAPGKTDQRQEVVAVTADTTEVVRHLGGSSVDVVVTDLPYGVQHGSTAGDGLRRSPADLLTAALPAWRKALRPGGALAMSWNTKVLPRDELVATVEAAGLAVLAGEPFEEFAHRVDQAVDRDVVVARRS
jgi:SAM-dependent methyltransferase